MSTKTNINVSIHKYKDSYNCMCTRKKYMKKAMFTHFL